MGRHRVTEGSQWGGGRGKVGKEVGVGRWTSDRKLRIDMPAEGCLICHLLEKMMVWSNVNALYTIREGPFHNL